MNSKALSCAGIQSEFSAYLDSEVTGVVMQRIADHLRTCQGCAIEFEELCQTQAAVASLASVKAPGDLALRLRVAISNERAHTPGDLVARLKVRWDNSVAPFLLQASAGFASAILLIGTAALLVGMFAQPEPLAARDEPLGMVSGPHYLYSAAGQSSSIGRGIPVVVEAYIDGTGRVYDYHIVSGPSDACTRSQLENLLLFSVFEPARFRGQPVRGLAVLSFSGISVHA